MAFSNEEDLAENVKKFPIFFLYMTNQMMNSMRKSLEKMHKVAESTGIENGRFCLQ